MAVPRSHVPKFGNWESTETVPYTIYFETARKRRDGKIINPNDPQEYPGMFPNSDPLPLAPASSNPPPRSRTKPDEPIGMGGASGPAMPEHRRSKEDGDFRMFSNSPARGENMGPKTTNRTARTARRSEGLEQGPERSPLHPHYQAKAVGKGSGSPAWEGKNQDSSHGTPGRSRLKPTTRGDESPDKGAAVPRFGEWENDPQSAEGFTHIFNKVREERNTEAGNNFSGTPKHPSYGSRPQPAKEAKKPRCFCW